MAAENMKPNTNPLAWKGCWLHRSRAICMLAMAFWIYSLIGAVLEMLGTFHPEPDRLLMLGCGVGIWFFATCAVGCNQRLERLFYYVVVVQLSIIFVRAAIPMPEAWLWLCEFMEATLSAIDIVLSGVILLWHFRTPMDGSGSKEPT